MIQNFKNKIIVKLPVCHIYYSGFDDKINPEDIVRFLGAGGYPAWIEWDPSPSHRDRVKLLCFICEKDNVK